jgi:PhnB protein
MTSHIPSGYHTVTPYLVVKGVAALMDFQKKGFHATEIERIPGPDGAVVHGEVRIGDSVVMLGEARTPQERTTSMLYLLVADPDASYRDAIAAGATSVAPVAEQFYGHRAGAVKDAAGTQWWVARPTQQLSQEELTRRAAQRSGKTKTAAPQPDKAKSAVQQPQKPKSAAKQPDAKTAKTGKAGK